MAETLRLIGTHLARRALAPLFMIVVLSASASPSQAQFEYGFGIGFENPQIYTNFVNTWSLQNAAAAAANRPQNLTAPRHLPPDISGFMQRYDVATREAIVNRVARNPSREMGIVNPTSPSPRPTPPPEAEPQPTPVVLLANYFDRDRRLVWPIDAPVTAGMGEKRRLADQAILAVLNQYELEGLAQLSTVTDAREKLLDYGRPALDFARNQTSPAVADLFHAFLLTLYANVGLAATVPRTP
jgi:hypothetical protein